MLGLALMGFLASSPVFIGSMLPKWVAIIPAVLIMLWFFTLLLLPSVLKHRRASDILLSADGVAVEAGPHRGRRWAWESLKSIHFQSGPGEDDLALRVGHDVLASSDEPAEIESLIALAETLAILARGELVEEPSWTNISPKVAHCATCGAPLVITSAPTVSCDYCGAVAVLSEELASLVADVHSLEVSRKVTLRAVELLLRWPSAARVNGVLVTSLIPLIFAWPAAAVFASEFFQYHDVLSWSDVGVVWLGTCAFTLALVLWVEGQVVHRRAFALLVASFRARVLDAKRGLLGCRCCGAPLGARSDELVATCVYCRSESVLVGLDIPVHRHEGQARSLRELAVERVRSMRTWRGLGVVAFCMALAGVALLAGPVLQVTNDSAPRHPSIDRPWSYEPSR